MLAPFFPGVELTGYIVIGFDGTTSPHMASDAPGADKIIAGLSMCLFGLTNHELTGEPVQPEDMLEITYRSGAETLSLACPACGCLGWARTPGGVVCGGCNAAYSGEEIGIMVRRAGGLPAGRRALALGDDDPAPAPQGPDQALVAQRGEGLGHRVDRHAVVGLAELPRRRQPAGQLAGPDGLAEDVAQLHPRRLPGVTVDGPHAGRP